MMKTKTLSLLAATLLFSWLAISTTAHAADITVFAAASLTDSLKEAAKQFEKQGGDKVIFNFAASSTLSRQIEAGAPADLFLSADEAKADYLEKKGLLTKGTRKSLLSNSLVIVVATDAAIPIKGPEGLTASTITHIALGDPKSVPIGLYSKEYLSKLGLWKKVEPKVVSTESVRAALAAVEMGNADASMVYKTDAAISKKVKVVFEVPADQGPKISYPMALIKDSAQQVAARKFYDFLCTKEAAQIFEKYGFIVK